MTDKERLETANQSFTRAPVSARDPRPTEDPFKFSSEDVAQMNFNREQRQRTNSEGGDDNDGVQDDNTDTMSLLSERLVEKEGVTRNPDLIHPEVDDDFFELMSQRSQSSFSHRGALQRTTTPKSTRSEARGNSDLNKLMMHNSRSEVQIQPSSRVNSNMTGSIVTAEESKTKAGNDTGHKKAPMGKDFVHLGSQDSKFAAMFNEGMRNFRVRQFQKDRASADFGLMDPTLLNGKYVVYKVAGSDKTGPFEGNRRYNEFFLLRQVMVANWPGIYIPSTPSKKLVGNKDVRFIIERRYFLERFVLQLSMIPALVESNEFQTFMRPTIQLQSSEVPDIEKLLKDIPQEPPSRILAKYKEAFNVNDEQIEIHSGHECRLEANHLIANFDEFLKKMLLHFKDIKKKVVALMEIKADQMGYQRQIFSNFGKYEERSFSYFNDKPEIQVKALNRMVIGGSHNELMADFMRAQDSLLNPFSSVFYWIKGQVTDVKAMRDGLASRENIIAVIQKIKSKKSSVQKELDNSMNGRTTLKTFFKSSNEKQSYNQQLQKQISSLESSERNYAKLLVIIDLRLIQYSATFKRAKVEDFSAIVREIAQIEVDNSNYQANFWSSFLQDPKMTTVGETTSVNIPL